jgi:ElaB/YqjD/DUF883 family membrane-anchored ribosome-binding protein
MNGQPSCARGMARAGDASKCDAEVNADWGEEVTGMTLEETAESAVRNVMDHGRETVHKAAQAAKGAYKAARQYAEDERLNLDLGDFVRREPWLAVAAAFAIGYVAAQIVRRVS